MNKMSERAFKAAQSFNAMNPHRKPAMDSNEMVKRIFEIEGSQENIDTIESMLTYMQLLGDWGHSTGFNVSVDGDGSARIKMKVDGNEPNFNMAKKYIDENGDVKGFSFE